MTPLTEQKPVWNPEIRDVLRRWNNLPHLRYYLWPTQIQLTGVKLKPEIQVGVKLDFVGSRVRVSLFFWIETRDGIRELRTGVSFDEVASKRLAQVLLYDRGVAIADFLSEDDPDLKRSWFETMERILTHVLCEKAQLHVSSELTPEKAAQALLERPGSRELHFRLATPGLKEKVKEGKEGTEIVVIPDLELNGWVKYRHLLKCLYLSS